MELVVGEVKKKRLLVIDGTNNFYRSYIVDPSLSSNGAPIGGVKGFVKILQKLCRETKPDEIVICWDGAGGSKRRQNMSKGYKAGRKPLTSGAPLSTRSRTSDANRGLPHKSSAA